MDEKKETPQRLDVIIDAAKTPGGMTDSMMDRLLSENIVSGLDNFFRLFQVISERSPPQIIAWFIHNAYLIVKNYPAPGELCQKCDVKETCRGLVLLYSPLNVIKELKLKFTKLSFKSVLIRNNITLLKDSLETLGKKGYERLGIKKLVEMTQEISDEARECITEFEQSGCCSCCVIM